MDKVAKVSAHGNATAKIVVPLEELPPQRAVAAFEQREAQRFQISKGRLNGRLRIAASICSGHSGSAPSRQTQVRQRQQSLLLGSLQSKTWAARS